jgi:teichoic acid transport system ATP-binding protein
MPSSKKKSPGPSNKRRSHAAPSANSKQQKASHALESSAEPTSSGTSSASSTAPSTIPTSARVPTDRKKPHIAITTDRKNPTAIRFFRISKSYRLYKNERQRFLSVFSNRVPHEIVKANDNLSFNVKRGESVALLGSNGAGKSTALKIIAGVTQPDRGLLEVNGRVSALLDLSAGFDAQLTGRENLKLRCQVWGLSPARIEDLLPEIIEFSELGTFIDQPIKTYSSGMRARLGFAFASSLRPDILILDEVLSVGDRHFSQKSLARTKEIMSRANTTVLFVTHALSAAQEFCSRGVVIEHGRAVFDGEISKALDFYKSRS